MKNTLGVIFGNWDFFPDHLVTEARKDIEKLFKDLEIEGVLVVLPNFGDEKGVVDTLKLAGLGGPHWKMDARAGKGR